MKTQGRHVVCELTGCPAEKLSSVEHVKAEIYAAAVKANATVLHGFFHHFAPNGVTGMLCLAESHIAIHTWPETGYVAIDIYTCGETATPLDAIDYLATAFEAQQRHVLELARGVQDINGRYVSSPVRVNGGSNPIMGMTPTDSSPRPRAKYKPVPVD
ncbi:MAG: adenosylmethionine decarboxylase [Planctomycetota bacterium]